MFLTKGIISLFGNKSRSIDINNLPDIDSSEDVHNFLNSLKSEIKLWKFDKDLRTLVDFLIDISEKYEIEKYIGPIWLEVLQNNLNSDLLQGLLDISLSMSERNVEIFDVTLMQTSDFLQVAWTVLIEKTNPMTKFTILKILINLPIVGTFPRFLNDKPDRVNSLLDNLKEPYDYVRNGNQYLECLLLISKIGKDNEDICKLLAFQGIFEILCEIVRQEDDVVGKDSWKLMKTLMGKFNRDYIREIPIVFNTISDSILGNQQESILDLLISACSQNEDEPYTLNQKYFSRLLDKVAICAFPLSGPQDLRALKLLEILLKNKGSDIESLTNAENSDLLDLILCYSTSQVNFEANFKILGLLIDSYSAISENFICRVTCVPGYETISGQQVIFNYLLNNALDEPKENLQYLCRVLEVILFNNEQAKQLATHLPVNMNSNNLLSRILQLWSSSLLAKPNYLPHLTRLLITWVHDSLETCQKSSDFIFNLIPTIFKTFNQTGLNESLTALFLAIICYQTKSSEIRNLILSQIEYQDFKSRIEYLAQVPEFKKCSVSGALTSFYGAFSVSLVKVYSSAVQPVIRYFVKGLTESAPKEQKDLAKLFEVHEAFSSMQYLRQGSAKDTALLEQEIKHLKEDLQDKNEEIENLRLEVRRANLVKNQENRRNLNVLVATQEKLDLTEFENQSLRRENLVLKAKVERLTEELQVFAGKRIERQSELKFIELKENLIVNLNENKALKRMLEKKNEELEEALEVIGKLKHEMKDCTEIINFGEPIELRIETKKWFSINPSISINLAIRDQLQNSDILSASQKIIEVKNFSEEIFEDETDKEKESLSDHSQNEKIVEESYLEKDTEIVKESTEFVENGEILTQEWFKDPVPNQDAFNFFDNLDSGSKIGSFFQ